MRRPYRGRLAPSPTGLLHLGHASTFWHAWNRSVEHGGTLVFRNDDLDPQRSRRDLLAAAIEDLRWLGLDWQEGPDVGGPCAPYSQSERHGLYLEAWRRLRGGGWLYPCRCSRRELQQVAQAPHEESDEPIYAGTCRPSNEADLRDDPSVGPEGRNWRLRVPEGAVVEFVDGRFGPQRFVHGVDFGDFIVWRRDGVPSYQLACAVDDAAMSIAEVVRGADLLRSTARQILLQRALGLPQPAYFHCPLLRDAAGVRLAKRHDALSLRALRERGVEPATIVAAIRGGDVSALLHAR